MAAPYLRLRGAGVRVVDDLRAAGLPADFRGAAGADFLAAVFFVAPGFAVAAFFTAKRDVFAAAFAGAFFAADRLAGTGFISAAAN
jgi:hypothetical protein